MVLANETITSVLTLYLKWASGHLKKYCIQEEQKIQNHFVGLNSSQQFAHATAIESTEFLVRKSIKNKNTYVYRSFKSSIVV